MIAVKEFKGDAKHPNIEDLINEFFSKLPETMEIFNIQYGNALLPSKDTTGKVSYIIVSTALIFYDDGIYPDDDNDEE